MVFIADSRITIIVWIVHVGALSVPSVVPLKIRFVGNGKTGKATGL